LTPKPDTAPKIRLRSESTSSPSFKLRIRIQLRAYLCHAFTYILCTSYYSYRIRIRSFSKNSNLVPKNIAGLRIRSDPAPCPSLVASNYVFANEKYNRAKSDRKCELTGKFACCVLGKLLPLSG